MTASIPVDSERLVPIWLSVQDLELVEQCLDQYASTRGSDADQQQRVAAVKKHFDWVRREFVIEPA